MYEPRDVIKFINHTQSYTRNSKNKVHDFSDNNLILLNSFIYFNNNVKKYFSGKIK